VQILAVQHEEQKRNAEVTQGAESTEILSFPNNLRPLLPKRALSHKHNQIPVDFGIGIGIGIEIEADPDSDANADKPKQQNIFMLVGAPPVHGRLR
jgi:hypothetical protein